MVSKRFSNTMLGTRLSVYTKQQMFEKLCRPPKSQSEKRNLRVGICFIQEFHKTLLNTENKNSDQW